MKTPTQAGLVLTVTNGPKGEVHEGWPCIHYTVKISRPPLGTPIWEGPFSLGVGHVQVPRHFVSWKFKAEEQRLLETWQRKPGAQFVDKQLWADVAAKLARFQHVEPKLDDVCHSLLMDGSAFFDAHSFETWAQELGYDTDSRKAEAIFRACCEIGAALTRAFTREDLDGLREWASNY